MTYEELTEEQKKQMNPTGDPAIDAAIAYAKSVGFQPDAAGQTGAAPAQQPATSNATATEAAPQQIVQPASAPAQQRAQTVTPAPAQASQPRQLGSIAEEGGRYLDEMRTAGEAAIRENTAASQRAAEFMRQQNEERQRRDDEEWEKVKAGQKRLEDYWAERLREQERDTREAQEENERRTRMENRRASIVGAGELAASLINLYAVGSLHASNQVYKDHMQDWMRKADADRKMRRARIDNLRDRQRGIQDKLEGLRAANTQDAYNRWRNQAAADAAAAQKEADRQKAEEAALAKRDADMQTKGFIPDPNSETGYRFDPQLAREIALSKSIRAASGRVTSSPQKGGSSKRETASPSATSKGTPAKSSSANAGPTQANPATNAASSVPFYLTAATVATTANGNNAQKAGGFKDWAYRMPHEESEFKKKREFFGWPDPKAGTPINPPKPANPPKQEEEKTKKTGTWEDEF